MKRLLLLRHAKSSWDDPSIEDFHRPLNEKGKCTAPLMAAHIKDQGISWDKCLCSPSTRTKATWAYIRAKGQRALFPKELYLATSTRIMNLLGEKGGQANSILIIGHNPGLHELCLLLAKKGERLDLLHKKFPTAALAVLECDIGSWDGLTPGCATLCHYVRPKDLL